MTAGYINGNLVCSYAADMSADVLVKGNRFGFAAVFRVHEYFAASAGTVKLHIKACVCGKLYCIFAAGGVNRYISVVIGNVKGCRARCFINGDIACGTRYGNVSRGQVVIAVVSRKVRKLYYSACGGEFYLLHSVTSVDD